MDPLPHIQATIGSICTQQHTCRFVMVVLRYIIQRDMVGIVTSVLDLIFMYLCSFFKVY